MFDAGAVVIEPHRVPKLIVSVPGWSPTYTRSGVPKATVLALGRKRPTVCTSVPDATRTESHWWVVTVLLMAYE